MVTLIRIQGLLASPTYLGVSSPTIHDFAQRKPWEDGPAQTPKKFERNSFIHKLKVGETSGVSSTFQGGGMWGEILETNPPGLRQGEAMAILMLGVSRALTKQTKGWFWGRKKRPIFSNDQNPVWLLYL